MDGDIYDYRRLAQRQQYAMQQQQYAQMGQGIAQQGWGPTTLSSRTAVGVEGYQYSAVNDQYEPATILEKLRKEIKDWCGGILD